MTDQKKETDFPSPGAWGKPVQAVLGEETIDLDEMQHIGLEDGTRYYVTWFNNSGEDVTPMIRAHDFRPEIILTRETAVRGFRVYRRRCGKAPKIMHQRVWKKEKTFRAGAHLRFGREE